ncbi:hypothetical protein [Streptomyces sp. NPDC088789]|uniref:hypothetical protein n=1 Tax=Streptomyces sp. NPDC088789 TaxID=3365899 RepID=UPI0038124497
MTSTAHVQLSDLRHEVREALLSSPGPTIVYDSVGIRDEFQLLRRHMESALGDRYPVELLFSVKANGFAGLLRWCAAEGIGAAVASTSEFEAAQAAGMAPIHATAPGLTTSQITPLLAAGVAVDADNVAQLAAFPGGTEVGLRVQVPLFPDNTPRAEGVSRFGIDLNDPALKELLADGDRRVVRLHAHIRDIGTPTDLETVAAIVVGAATQFPEVRQINLGGGMTRLYKEPERAAEAWQAFGRALKGLPGGITMIVEPGAQVVTRHGYLATDVVSSLARPDGRRLVTLDASKWRLITWADVNLIAPLPGAGETARTDLVGPTCYEKDIWMTAADMPVLAAGDRVTLQGLGAYVTSMARRMHDLPDPCELLV